MCSEVIWLYFCRCRAFSQLSLRSCLRLLPRPRCSHLISVELSHSLKVSNRRRHAPKSCQNRSESLCAGLWAPCRVFWAWFGLVLGPLLVRNRRFPAGSLKIAEARLAQPSHVLYHLGSATMLRQLRGRAAGTAGPLVYGKVCDAKTPRAGYLKAVWPVFLGCVFEVWPAPGARESLQIRGGRSPPPF